MKEIVSKWDSGSLTAYYVRETEGDASRCGVVGLTVLPSALNEKFTTDGNTRVENLVQVKLAGDIEPSEYSMGRSMRNSQSTWDLKYVSQEVKEFSGEITGSGREIVTTLESARIRAKHHLIMRDGQPFAEVLTEIENITEETETLEMLSSFSLCNLSPIEAGERIRDLYFLRLQSRWSEEGKLLRQSLLDLHMEPDWVRQGCQVERYGQIGSMPVRGWFPWGVLEDAKYGFMTGAQLYFPGSWQMELSEHDDKVCFSGGLADREFGHFTKKLAPGEKFEAPKAVIASTVGGVDEISDALCTAQNDAMRDLPESERDLPFIFNEYCTTWGNPTEENLAKITRQIRGKGFKYLVVDCGWFSAEGSDWWACQGDWDLAEERFPGGLLKTTEMIREAGMIPGIWFEFEAIGNLARAFTEKTDWMLKRDGYPITEGIKRFYDLKKPEVQDFLTEKVIGFLQKYHFGYIKVDYNGNYGIGPDGEDGFGEELRKTVLATQEFFRKIRREIPDIVIENCASGGHREEPSMMAVSSMSSFSDAHETVMIPVIAASLHRAILPRQSQIWAVMRATDDERRLVYTMANTLLGRCCLSGDIYDMSPEQWGIIEDGMAFYKKAVPIIRSGKSVITRNERMDYNHPDGVQVVVRTGRDDAEGRTLVVVHRFADEPSEIRVAIPAGSVIEDTYAEKSTDVSVEGNALVIRGMQEFSACGVLLKA